MNRWTVAIATLGALMAAAPARPQTPAPSPSPTISEYVEVTATRIPEDINTVPVPIEVISGDDLRAFGRAPGFQPESGGILHQ